MKPRRDITLGEMQDECKKHTQRPCACKTCPYDSWCGDGSPNSWNLTDPPRFTEAQMAFWKWWRKQGADYVYGEVFPAQHSERERRYLVFVQQKPYQEIGRVEGKMHEWIETCETLDLAELLGKDGAE